MLTSLLFKIGGNDTGERQQGAAELGTELALDYLLSETGKARRFLSDCSSFSALSISQAGCSVSARLGSAGSLRKVGQGLYGCCEMR